MINSYGERILVRIVEKEEKKGILLVPPEKKEFQIGRVVDPGDAKIEARPECFALCAGDFVYTRKYAGLVIEYDDVEYVSLDTKEILAFSKELR